MYIVQLDLDDFCCQRYGYKTTKKLYKVIPY